MAFEEFIPRRVSSKEPCVTISKAGLMLFNVSSVSEYIKDNKYVKLYYDADTKRIGVKLLTEKEINVVTITKGKNTNRNSAILSIKSFLNLYKINYQDQQLRGLSCEMDSALGMLIVQLP